MSQYYVTTNGSYVLYHSGIKGMKWGIRRFQNEDGSLTEAGKKRYGKLVGKIQKEEQRIERYQNNVDRNANRYARAARKQARANRLQAKSARLHNKAVNGWLISDKKRAKLEVKSQRLAAKSAKLASKAAKMQNKTIKNEAKIRRAQSHINKYARKIAKFNPSSTYAGTKYINGYANTRLNDL